MKEKIITSYRCDHCNKFYQRPKACLKHEIACFQNPKNKRPCFNCNHLIKEDYTIYNETPFGKIKRVINIFKCTKYDRFLHTPQNEIKNNAYELGNHDNNPMPIKCDGFSSFYECNIYKF